ncbi:MAG: hypothetical protein JWP25_9004 [Bradyrhizobium sp.]|nr:hypothetical protein [Bradyrhizobium sp.]
MRRKAPLVFDSLDMPTVHTFRNIIGVKRGRLSVKSFAGIRKKRSYWLCDCECGATATVIADGFNAGNVSSCGCLQSEATIARNKLNSKHGHNGYNSPEYRSWTAMKSRCCNPNNKRFDIYGGGGVMVCDRWLNSFEAFLSDMGPRPIGTSLDRFPDKEGNYEPNNCRWANAIEQNRNRRPQKQRRTATNQTEGISQ